MQIEVSVRFKVRAINSECSASSAQWVRSAIERLWLEVAEKRQRAALTHKCEIVDREKRSVSRRMRGSRFCVRWSKSAEGGISPAYEASFLKLVIDSITGDGSEYQNLLLLLPTPHSPLPVSAGIEGNRTLNAAPA